jgi:uncharacterized protein
MDEQDQPSPNLIDHRGWKGHAAGLFLGCLLGFFGHDQLPTHADPDWALIQTTSTAMDRGDDFWSARLTTTWRPFHLVMLDQAEDTACGVADRRSGPFYCPKSERIYLDLSFLQAIPGSLARAYVIAHEIGHHIQKLRNEFNHPQIDLELQADCYAGMWMHEETLHGHLANGDFAAALAEAGAVGDDRIAPGSTPETWTHGSAAQRMEALQAGFGGGPCTI